MQQQTDIIAFIQEAFARMSAKSPRFFQVYQTIGKVASLVGGIPALIAQIASVCTMFGIHMTIPEVLNATILKLVAIAGVVMWFMAKQPVTDPHAPVDKNDEELRKEQVMPFTVKKQTEEIYGTEKI